ncbi:BTB/POZ domain-containing protein 3-like [Paramacrobiotus metropolitanus]|uniref:BTB/POZ domain-containing protein 3-like n=1 Tax=Paramacrobiotus metropolitanus TaxID=2943436 RepID=UPI0024455E80|nr:BTB/POZ domain-containing protein 3-like [Paramacrobiotus metropolitanus]
MSLILASSSTQDRKGSDVLDCMKQALASGDLSDVQFAVGRYYGYVKIFYAHKTILAMRNEVFRRMFFGSLPEKCKDAIDIPDILPEAFNNMLNLVYTGAVEDLSDDNVFPTINCADKYDFPLLTEMCSEFIMSQLNADNFLMNLEDAIHWGAKGIAEKCLELLDVSSDDCETIFRSERFASVGQMTLRKILQRDTLSVDENLVYSAAERWAVESCKRNNVPASPVNRRRMLGAALFLIRFPLLSEAELADGPVKSGLLLSTELHEILMHKHGTAQPCLPFSSEPRQPRAFRIGQVEFKRNEEVFAVLVRGSSFWFPAQVIGRNQSQVLVSMCVSPRQRERVAMSLEKVIPAADVLTRGRSIVTDYGIKAVYMAPRDNLHILSDEGHEWAVPFKDIRLFTDDVQAWKEAKKRIAGQRPSVRRANP